MVTALCGREDVCCITRRNKIPDKVVSHVVTQLHKAFCKEYSSCGSCLTWNDNFNPQISALFSKWTLYTYIILIVGKSLQIQVMQLCFVTLSLNYIDDQFLRDCIVFHTCKRAAAFCCSMCCCEVNLLLKLTYYGMYPLDTKLWRNQAHLKKKKKFRTFFCACIWEREGERDAVRIPKLCMWVKIQLIGQRLQGVLILLGLFHTWLASMHRSGKTFAYTQGL